MKQKLAIESLDDRGRGVGADWHIPFTYPGDIVEAELVNKRKKAARLVELLTPSPYRLTPPCSFFGQGGGCPWQGIKYEAQLKFKEDKVRGLFGDVLPIIPSPEEYFYRNRMDFAFGPNYTVGLKDNRDNIIDIKKCWLMSEKSNTIVERLRQFIAEHELKEYPAGIMRHVVIREGKNQPNTFINVLTSDKGRFPIEEFWNQFKGLADGVSWSINLSLADRSYGEIQKILGQDHLIESLNGIKFNIPPQSFFQTNTHQAEKLLLIVKEFAAPNGSENLLDLYSGTGSLGLYLAGKVKHVTGIEESEAAVALSKTNAELNGLKNYAAFAGRAEDLLASFSGQFELVVVDPPRPGLHKRVVKKLGEMKAPKVVYVSCNPVSQAFDLTALKEFGYKVAKSQPLDMFPHTPHIENVLLLKRD